jgi:hypothetical protein
MELNFNVIPTTRKELISTIQYYQFREDIVESPIYNMTVSTHRLIPMILDFKNTFASNNINRMGKAIALQCIVMLLGSLTNLISDHSMINGCFGETQSHMMLRNDLFWSDKSGVSTFYPFAQKASALLIEEQLSLKKPPNPSLNIPSVCNNMFKLLELLHDHKVYLHAFTPQDYHDKTLMMLELCQMFLMS